MGCGCKKAGPASGGPGYGRVKGSGLTYGGESGAIAFVDLGVEGEEVVDPADTEEASGEEVEDTGAPFAQIEAVEADETEEGEGLENPRERVIIRPGDVFAVGGAVHGGD